MSVDQSEPESHWFGILHIFSPVAWLYEGGGADGSDISKAVE